MVEVWLASIISKEILRQKNLMQWTKTYLFIDKWEIKFILSLHIKYQVYIISFCLHMQIVWECIFYSPFILLCSNKQSYRCCWKCSIWHEYIQQLFPQIFTWAMPFISSFLTIKFPLHPNPVPFLQDETHPRHIWKGFLLVVICKYEPFYKFLTHYFSNVCMNYRKLNVG